MLQCTLILVYPMQGYLYFCFGLLSYTLICLPCKRIYEFIKQAYKQHKIRVHAIIIPFIIAIPHNPTTNCVQEMGYT